MRKQGSQVMLFRLQNLRKVLEVLKVGHARSHENA